MIVFLIKLQRQQERISAIALNKEMRKAFRRFGRQFAESQSLVKPNFLKTETKRKFKEVLFKRRMIASSKIKNYLLKKGKAIKKEDDIYIIALNRHLFDYNERRADIETGAMYTNFEKSIDRVINTNLVDVGFYEIPRVFREVEPVLFEGKAKLLARNLVGDAISEASLSSAKTIEREHDIKLKKVWVATEDSRTRPTHNEADGQTVDLADDFVIGGANMERPNDPFGPIEEIINCRCKMIYV